MGNKLLYYCIGSYLYCYGESLYRVSNNDKLVKENSRFHSPTFPSAMYVL